MFVVRPVNISNLEVLYNFSRATSMGIINLPTHFPALKRLIEDSSKSFQSKIIEPGKEIYTFVIENTLAKEVVGTSSIFASAGVRTPYCTYYIENLPEGENEPLEGCNHALLYPRHYESGPSELCALYLTPSYRKGGLGKLLSFSRMLFIAANPHLFSDSIFADMRGYITPDEQSPFWSATGKKIFNWSYREVIEKLSHEELYLTSLISNYPIHWCLLPAEAQKYIGKTHPNTQAAYYLLNNQGFCFQREISILDGGPIITASKMHIRIIANSHLAYVGKINDILDTSSIEVMLANESLSDFRACSTRIAIKENDQIEIDKLTAQVMNIEIDTPVRYSIL